MQNVCKKTTIFDILQDVVLKMVKCSCENGKYVESITVDLVITFYEHIDETKAVPTYFNGKM